MKKRRIPESVIICAVTLVAALFFELVIFKIPYFVKCAGFPEAENLVLSDAILSGSAGRDGEGNIFIVNNGDAAIRFNGMTRGFKSIRVYGFGEQGYRTMTVTQRNLETSLEHVYTQRFSPSSPESMYFETVTDGTSFILSFKDCESMTITGISLNTPPDYEVFALRIAIIWLVLIFAVCAVKYKLFNVIFDASSPAHSAAIAATVAILIGISTFISTFYSAYTVEYPLEDDSLAYGNYVEQTDAFIKGQVELNLKVPDRLLECDNPYDPQDRADHRVSTEGIWDKAFYNGKFYSYFGVVPVILVYLPAYYLTGRMATDMLSCYIFSLISIVFVCLLMREIAIRYLKKVRLVLLCFGMAAVCGAGLVFLMESSANFYTVAVMGAIAFVPAYLFLSLRACRAEKTWARCALFAAAGLCLALTVGCRPNAALYGAVVLPALFGVLREKETSAGRKTAMVMSFALPIIAGVGALMWYNMIRFSGPLDFGNNYQLTVSDTAQNTLRLHLLPEALYHYFFQFPSVEFPFMTMSRVKLPTYNVDYIYIGENLGAVTFACNWALLPCFAAVLATGKKKRPKTEPVLFCTILILLAVVLSFTDMCLAGAHVRYTADMMMAVAIVSVTLMLAVDSRINKKILTYVLFALMIVTVYAGLIMTLDNEVDLIMHNSADLLLYLRRMLGCR